MCHRQIIIIIPILCLCKEILDLIFVNSFFLTSKYGRQVLPSFTTLPNFPAYYQRANPSLLHSVQFRRMYVLLTIRNIGGNATV